MKKDTFYFSHDYNASQDAKILFLRQQLGMEGYGIYWFLVESLAQAGGMLPCRILPVLAMQMQVTEIKVKAVIDQFDLFKMHEDSFYSERLNLHLQMRATLSQKGLEGAAKRWEKQRLLSPPNSPPIGEGNAKERKGKEKKGKEKKETAISVTEPEFLAYCREVLKEKYASLEFSLKAKYLQWSADGWRDGNGKEIKNWKTKILNTIPFMRPDQKKADDWRKEFSTEKPIR